MIIYPNTPHLSQYRGRGSWLHLRPFEHSDLPTCYSWLDDAITSEHVGAAISRYKSLEVFQSIDWGQRVERGFEKWWFALRTDDNSLIGTTTATLEPKEGVVHWGVSIIGPDNLRGIGIGSEVKKVLLKYFFNVRGATCVRTFVSVHNVPSLRYNLQAGAKQVSRKNGFCELEFRRP
jgi:RimJ/RimL family protein N-acetyltransferase